MPEYLRGADGQKLAYISQSGRGPAVVFLGGFRSDMSGTKAGRLRRWCADRDIAWLGLDYRGHGRSGGRFEDYGIGDWTDDALRTINHVVEAELVLVGSSMGGFIAARLLESLAGRVRGLVAIAAAADLVTRLILPGLSGAERHQYARDGAIDLDSDYDPGGYRIGRPLLDGAGRYNILDRRLQLDGPAILLHGEDDTDVPWSLSLELMQALDAWRAELRLIKGGDHRLSTPAELESILGAVEEVWGRASAASP